jgi:hypothetical protein
MLIERLPETAKGRKLKDLVTGTPFDLNKTLYVVGQVIYAADGRKSDTRYASELDSGLVRQLSEETVVEVKKLKVVECE